MRTGMKIALGIAAAIALVIIGLGAGWLLWGRWLWMPGMMGAASGCDGWSGTPWRGSMSGMMMGSGPGPGMMHGGRGWGNAGDCPEMDSNASSTAGEISIEDVQEAVEIRARYAGYLQRERRQIERYQALEAQAIPSSFEYAAVAELRHEAREKFARFQPRSLGQAARISGISPADIATLSVYLFQSRHRYPNAPPAP